MGQSGTPETFEDALQRHMGGQRFPVQSSANANVMRELWEMSQDLPTSYSAMMRYLRQQRYYAVYDVAIAFTHGLLRDNLSALALHPPSEIFHTRGIPIPDDIKAPIVRRYIKGTQKNRQRALMLMRQMKTSEVALPASANAPWDVSGWRRGIKSSQSQYGHPSGTRRQLAAGVPALTTIAQLRELLEIRSARQLGFFLLATDHTNLKPYHTFKIPKKTGGERLIAAPNPQLLGVQRRILSEILAPLPVHDAAHGFVPGRSTLTNAAPHVGKSLLIKFDLSDFFPTIRYWRVVGLFSSFGYSVGHKCFATGDENTEIATTLARLCCYSPHYKQTSRAYTPQGAPTSPAISNLICRTLDKRLNNLAQKLGGDYTRYADDLSFSFHETPEKGIGRFRWWVNQICHQEGFLVREDKFRVIRASQQQRVTGIVVNDKLSLPRKDRRRFRAILHNCERHGLASQARDRPDFESYLMGYAAYLNMVHPTEGAEMLRRVKALLVAGG